MCFAINYFMEQLDDYKYKTGKAPNGVVLQDWLYYQIKSESPFYHECKFEEFKTLCGIEVRHGDGDKLIYFY